MRREILMTIFLTIAFIAITSTQTNAQEKPVNKKLAKQAKITMEQAKEIALKREAGSIEDGELEKEHGKVVYSFDIRNSKGTITEIQVDAKTGEIANVEEEDAKAEAKEKAKEKKHN